MKVLNILAVFVFVSTLFLTCASSARAADNDLTYFTFSAPVEIPGGMVLPAGTYTFKILNTMSDRNIVQILDKKQQKLIATVLTIPDYRTQPSSKTVIRFSEANAGGPPAIKEWFYPGNSYGNQFVYPKARAVELAKASNQAVPSMPQQPATSSSDASVTALQNSSLKAQKPSGEEVEVAEAFIVTAPAVNDPNANTAHNVNTEGELPATASMLPALWMAGFSLMIAGALLWLVAKRTA